MEFKTQVDRHIDLKYLTKPGKKPTIHASLGKSIFGKPKLDLVLAQWLQFLSCIKKDYQMKKMDMGRKKGNCETKMKSQKLSGEGRQPLSARRSLILVLNWDTP